MSDNNNDKKKGAGAGAVVGAALAGAAAGAAAATMADPQKREQVKKTAQDLLAQAKDRVDSLHGELNKQLESAKSEGKQTLVDKLEMAVERLRKASEDLKEE